jgi:hypothetical protein
MSAFRSSFCGHKKPTISKFVVYDQSFSVVSWVKLILVIITFEFTAILFSSFPLAQALHGYASDSADVETSTASGFRLCVDVVQAVSFMPKSAVLTSILYNFSNVKQLKKLESKTV